MAHLKLDQALVDEACALAQHIVEPVIDYIGIHTTVAIERATLRLIGVDGVDENGVPLPNCVVERALPLLSGGILRPFVAAMLERGLDTQATAEAIGRSEIALQEVNTTYERWALLGIGEPQLSLRFTTCEVKKSLSGWAALLRATKAPVAPFITASW